MAAQGNSDADGVEAGVRRTVGIAALRRLRRLVDAERAQDEANARALPLVIGAVVIVAVALVAVFLPQIWRVLRMLIA